MKKKTVRLSRLVETGTGRRLCTNQTQLESNQENVAQLRTERSREDFEGDGELLTHFYYNHLFLRTFHHSFLHSGPLSFLLPLSVLCCQSHLSVSGLSLPSCLSLSVRLMRCDSATQICPPACLSHTHLQVFTSVFSDPLFSVEQSFT